MDKTRLQRILSLGLPIVGGMLSQNVLNLVDTAMVGFLGKEALAGVGMASFASFLAVAVIIGVSPAVQAMAARRTGEGRLEENAVPLNGGLLLAIAFGVPLSALLFLLAPVFFPWLVDDPRVVAEGVPYLRARLCGLVAVGANFAFRGYWNGVNLSMVYLRTIVVMHAVNVGVSYVLIFGKLGFPALGTLGAGIGTTFSVFLGSALYTLLAWREARGNGFLAGLPRRDTIETMLRVATPSCIRQFFFAAGATTLFWIIGRIGTAELAAASVLMNLMLVAVLPGMALGMSAATLVGQALGRGDVRDARRWGWDVVRVAVVVLAAIGLPMWALPEIVLSGFLHEARPLAIAIAPLRLIGAAMPIDAVGTVLMHAMLGAGSSRDVMLVSVPLQWGLFLPLSWLVGPVLGFGLLSIWMLWLAYRLLQAVCFTVLWRRGGWAEVAV